jgi:hypothetical protein
VKTFHQGLFTPKNPQKYRGDRSRIVYRSGWEAAVMYWLDMNDKITTWSSETVVVPYVSPVDNKVHRYIIDFLVETNAGTLLVEVKPQKECVPPKTRQGKRRQVVESEALTYAQNTAKWQAAEQYANSMGYKFQVWDEVTLRTLGVVIAKK